MFANILFFINVFNFACIISFIAYLVIRFYPQTATIVTPTYPTAVPPAVFYPTAPPLTTTTYAAPIYAPIAASPTATQAAVPAMPNTSTTASVPIPATVTPIATTTTPYTRRVAQVLPKSGNAFLTGLKSLF